MNRYFWAAGLLGAVVLTVSVVSFAQAPSAGGAFFPNGVYRLTGTFNFIPPALQLNGHAIREIPEAGNTALDGSNPTSVTMSPLTTIDGCTVSIHGSSAPGSDPTAVTSVWNATAGKLDIYAWKPNGSSDTSLVASTSTRQVDYSCAGR